MMPKLAADACRHTHHRSTAATGRFCNDNLKSCAVLSRLSTLQIAGGGRCVTGVGSSRASPRLPRPASSPAVLVVGLEEHEERTGHLQGACIRAEDGTGALPGLHAGARMQVRLRLSQRGRYVNQHALVERHGVNGHGGELRGTLTNVQGRGERCRGAGQGAAGREASANTQAHQATPDQTHPCYTSSHVLGMMQMTTTRMHCGSACL